MNEKTTGFIDNENKVKTKDFWIACPNIENAYDSQSTWKKCNSTPADFTNCVHVNHCKNYESDNNTADCIGGYYEPVKSLISKSEKTQYSKTIKIIKQHLNNGNPIHARTELNNLITKLGYDTK